MDGLLGQTNNNAIIVTTVDDLHKIDFEKSIYMYSQTTKSPEGYKEITKAIEKRVDKSKNNGVKYIVNDTLCRQVSGREPQLKIFSTSNDIIILTSNGVTYRGLDADDTYVISELITSDASISIVDNNGNNSIQILDNTKIVSSKWTSDAVKLTLNNNIDVTINGADEFSFNVGGNITTNDKGDTLTFAQFSEIFGLDELPQSGETLNGLDSGYII